MRESKRYSVPVAEQMSHRYSVESRVNDYISLLGDRS